MEPFSIELIEAIELKCSKRGIWKMLDKLTRKHQLRNKIQIYKLANMSLNIRLQYCVRKLCIWRLGRYMYVFYMSISRLYSSGMKLEVRKFRDLIEFDLQGFVEDSSILLYFISIRAWVENLHIKNCIKNLMVIILSYFYKENKYKTWKSSSKKVILVTL